MSKIPSSFLDLLRERVLLSHVIGPLVKLTKKNRDYMGLCPFHKEKTPSFTVHDDKKFYHCFGCGAHGDGIDFLTRHQGMSFLDAVETMARLAGLTVPQSMTQTSESSLSPTLYKIHQDAAQWFQQHLSQLGAPGAKKAQNYLKDRGIHPSSQTLFQIGYAPSSGLKDFLLKKYDLPSLKESGLIVEKNGQWQDRFRNRLMLPIFDRKGQIIAFGGRTLEDGIPKYLNSPETPLFHKGNVLYGPPLFERKSSKEMPLFVVEGYLDVISLTQANVGLAVATLGTALTSTHIEQLWRLSPEPILCFDGDDAGKRASFRALERALPLLKPGYSFHFVMLPQGEDPDSLIQKGGKTSWEEHIQRARPFQEILWSWFLMTHRFDTMERRAAARKALYHLLGQLEDPYVRQEYQDLMLEKWKALTQTPKNERKTNALARGEKVTRPTSPELIQQRLLLAIPLQHPALMPLICEDFAGLTFQYQPYEILKQKMILAFEDKKNLDQDDLYSYLCSQGEEEKIQDILRPDLSLHSRSIQPMTPLEDVRKAWNDILERYQGNKFLQADIQQAQERLQHSMTQEAWNRLKTLKTMVLSSDEAQKIHK